MEGVSATDTNTQEVSVNFKHNVKFSFDEDSKLSDMKSLINKEFMIEDQEYEIFVNSTQLLIINQETKIKTLIQNYQTKEFVIKTFKSNHLYLYLDTFDIKHQLIEINDFIEYNINKKSSELNEVIESFESLKKSLEA